jgi:DDE_Tnp_1-associated
MNSQELFGSVADPSTGTTCHHQLLEIIFIVFTTVTRSAEDFVTNMEYDKNRQDLFVTLLNLPHGIPSHDTFQRAFARLDPKLKAALITWSKHLRAAKQIQGEKIIALDGKTPRHYFDTALGVEQPQAKR